MPWNYSKLLLEIDREQIPRGAYDAFMRRRGEAYDYLLSAMLENRLNEKQAGHAVVLLLKLKDYKDVDEQNLLHKYIVEWANDERVQVRSQAVKGLFILTEQRRLTHTEKWQHEYQYATVVAKRALEMGLEPRLAEWLRASFHIESC